MEEIKKYWDKLDGLMLIRKRELFLGGALCLMTGLTAGLLLSPRKTVIIEQKDKEEEEKKVTYKDVWSITAWSVLIKRLIKHCEEHEELKACLMTEIVTPLKGKWVWAKGVSIRFMKLIETYPASLFLVAVGVKSDA